jgi:hypothetical protein
MDRQEKAFVIAAINKRVEEEEKSNRKLRRKG